MVGIYKITNPKGKIYIGQSINIPKRLYQYKKKRKECIGLKILNSLNKYGIENHSFDILEECEYDILNEREIYWIKYYNSTENGLNIEIGGSNGPRSQETKDKIQINSIGKNSKKIIQYDLEGKYIKIWPSIKEAEIIYGKGIKEVLSNKTKTSSDFIWRYESKPLSSNFKLDKYSSSKKPIIQYDLQGNFIKKWDSTIQVQNELGYHNPNLSSVALGKQKTAYGFKWKYEK